MPCGRPIEDPHSDALVGKRRVILGDTRWVPVECLAPWCRSDRPIDSRRGAAERACPLMSVCATSETESPRRCSSR